MLRRVGLRIAPRWSLARFRDLLGETRHLAGLQLLAAVQTQAEALLVPKLLGFGQNGLFSAGSLLANRLAIVPDGIGTAYYPVIARSHQRGVGHSAADVLRYLGVSVALCSVAAVGLTLLASPISRILFQEQAAACALVMQISAWSLPLLALSQGLEYCLNAAGREAEQATLGIWAMVPAVGLAVFLVYSFGLVGAAGSLVLRHALFTLFRLPCFLRTFGPGFGAARADLQVGLARAVKQFGLGGQEV
jgi:O-antigen/teichoic acid export membrane protein